MQDLHDLVPDGSQVAHLWKAFLVSTEARSERARVNERWFPRRARPACRFRCTCKNIGVSRLGGESPEYRTTPPSAHTGLKGPSNADSPRLCLDPPKRRLPLRPGPDTRSSTGCAPNLSFQQRTRRAPLALVSRGRSGHGMGGEETLSRGRDEVVFVVVCCDLVGVVCGGHGEGTLAGLAGVSEGKRWSCDVVCGGAGERRRQAQRDGRVACANL